jgi:hypothetical protein
MRTKLYGSLVILVAILIATAWWMIASNSNARAVPRLDGRGQSAASPRADSSLIPSKPLPTQGSAAQFARASAPSALSRRVLASSDLKAVYDEIDTWTDAPIAERLRYKAVIIDACSQYHAIAATSDPAVAEATRTGTMSQLISSLSGLMKSPQQRTAMEYQARTSILSMCKGFANTKITQADVNLAFQAAAAAGDPAAQAHVISQRLASERVAANLPIGLPGKAGQETGEPRGYPAPMTPAEANTLVNAIFSGDAIAIKAAGTVLSLDSDQQSLRIGSDEREIGQRSEEVWTLAACAFGFECGTENKYVAWACAELARCSPDYYSYLRDYVLTPTELASVNDATAIIVDAISRRDYSAFRVVDRAGMGRTLVTGPIPVQVH